jgi:hypothetical protein
MAGNPAKSAIWKRTFSSKKAGQTAAGRRENAFSKKSQWGESENRRLSSSSPIQAVEP